MMTMHKWHDQVEVGFKDHLREVSADLLKLLKLAYHEGVCVGEQKRTCSVVLAESKISWEMACKTGDNSHNVSLRWEYCPYCGGKIVPKEDSE